MRAPMVGQVLADPVGDARGDQPVVDVFSCDSGSSAAAGWTSAADDRSRDQGFQRVHGKSLLFVTRTLPVNMGAACSSGRHRRVRPA